MKFKFIFSVLCLGLIISSVSCKKEEEETTNTSGTSAVLGDEIRCKIDGTEVSFLHSGGDTHHYDTNYPPSPTGKLIQAGKAIQSSGITGVQVFAIDIWKDLDQMIIPTTYTVTPADIEDSSVDHLVWLSFTTGLTTYLSQMPGGSVSLTVTSKTGDLIEGTFSGKLYGNIIDLSNPFNIQMDSIQVTDGKFKVQLVRESID